MTIKDVANYLGMSVSTVSRCLNGRPDISEETKRRVNQAIQELNYVPSTSARTMSGRRSRIIGLTIPDISDPYFSKDAAGAEAIEDKLNEWLTYQEEGSRVYMTENMPLFQTGVIRRDGLTVSLIVSARVAEIEAVYRKYH